MRVRLPYIVQDQLTAAAKGMRPTEEFFYEREGEVFLDGPVCTRVATLDFDERSGALMPPVPFQAPRGSRKLGRYLDHHDPGSREFQRVSTFATVLKTLRTFEVADVLGRDIRWAFDGPQLLVVPRAGDMPNAFYERETRSLQLFSFQSLTEPGKTIHTGLSHDIVAHETGHAMLDGIAPDLYDAISPQALAVHEAVADLTALIMAVESHTLRRTVLDQTGGDIRGLSALSTVGEEFGRAQGMLYLRSLYNRKNFDPTDASRDEHGEPNHVSGVAPHDLSQVLSGTLYAVLVRIFERAKRDLLRRDGNESPTANDLYRISGRALAAAIKRFRRLMFRALDYLPPGEISFADYGRAVLASDQASYPTRGQERRWICDELVRRKVVSRAEDLAVETDFVVPGIQGVDLTALVTSDWAAYAFAGEHRRLLRIPQGVPFEVRPRLDVTKTTWHGGNERETRECIFKVTWEHVEANPLGRGFPARRGVAAGSTLVIDWKTRRVRALLTTDLGAARAHERTRFLRGQLAQDTLPRPGEGAGPDGRPLRSVLQASTRGERLRVRGAVRTLHVVGREGRS